MNETLQTYAALAVVMVTLGLFAWRMVRRRLRGNRGGSCGGGCGCSVKEFKPAPTVSKAGE